MKKEQKLLNISEPISLSEQLREMGLDIPNNIAYEIDTRYLELFERYNISKARSMFFKEPDEYSFEKYVKDIDELINLFGAVY